MKKVYETALLREDSVSHFNWMYEDGVLLTAMEYAGKLLDDRRDLPFLFSYLDHFITRDGRIPAVEKRPPSLDCINNGKVILAAYQNTGEIRYRKALSYLRSCIETHPRLTNCAGFSHKKIYKDQMWLDGLYMLLPFYAAYTGLWGPDSCFDDIAVQFELITKFAYNPDKGLYYHAYDHSRSMFWADPVTGCSPHFWGRAMGWLAMAAVDTLDFFPKAHPKREAILDVIQKIASGIIRYQSPSGVWYQIPDLPDREGNYKESSCSCMFAYFLKKALQNGYLPDSYSGYAQKAMDGILHEFVTEKEGAVNISNVCLVAGLGPAKKPERDGSFSYYISEPVVNNDNKAFGPLLWALARFSLDEPQTGGSPETI